MAKGSKSSSQFNVCHHRHQPSDGIGEGSSAATEPCVDHGRRTPTKAPVVEESHPESKDEEFDSQDDDHYEVEGDEDDEEEEEEEIIPDRPGP